MLRLLSLALITLTAVGCQSTVPDTPQPEPSQPTAVTPVATPQEATAPTQGVAPVAPSAPGVSSAPGELVVPASGTQAALVKTLKRYEGKLHDSPDSDPPSWKNLADTSVYTIQGEPVSKAFSWVTFKPVERSDETPPLHALYTSDLKKVVWAQTALGEPRHDSSHRAFVRHESVFVVSESEGGGGTGVLIRGVKVFAVEDGAAKEVLSRSFDLVGCTEDPLKHCEADHKDLVLPHANILTKKEHYIAESDAPQKLSYTFTTYPIVKKLSDDRFKVRKVVESCVWKAAGAFGCKTSKSKPMRVKVMW